MYSHLYVAEHVYSFFNIVYEILKEEDCTCRVSLSLLPLTCLIPGFFSASVVILSRSLSIKQLTVICSLFQALCNFSVIVSPITSANTACNHTSFLTMSFFYHSAHFIPKKKNNKPHRLTRLNMSTREACFI